jgi:hypothetical protein
MLEYWNDGKTKKDIDLSVFVSIMVLRLLYQRTYSQSYVLYSANTRFEVVEFILTSRKSKTCLSAGNGSKLRIRFSNYI